MPIIHSSVHLPGCTQDTSGSLDGVASLYTKSLEGNPLSSLAIINTRHGKLRVPFVLAMKSARLLTTFCEKPSPTTFSSKGYGAQIPCKLLLLFPFKNIPG